MAQLQAVGSMGYDQTVGKESPGLSLSNPAGWAMLFWIVAVVIILLLYSTL